MKTVHMSGNGLVDSYLVGWPGGGASGLTYGRSREVGQAKAKELGLPFVDESPRTLRSGAPVFPGREGKE
jgi:hypothetical protein